MWQVQMQFIPGNDQIWVLKLDATDPIWEFETEVEAIDKMNELASADVSGRLYRVIQN